MNPEILLRVFDQPIAFHRCLVPISGGVNAALLLGQLIYWTPRASSKDGWIYKTAQELENEIGLGRREQETARRALRDRGLVREGKKGIPPKIYFWVDVAALQMALENAFSVEMPRQPAPTSNLAESAKLISRETPTQFGTFRQNNTETTYSSSSSTAVGNSPAGSPTRNAFEIGPAGIHMWTQADRLDADKLVDDFGIDAVVGAIDQMNIDPLPGRVRYKLEQLARARQASVKRNRKPPPAPKAHIDLDPEARAVGEAMLAKIRQTKSQKQQGATP